MFVLFCFFQLSTFVNKGCLDMILLKLLLRSAAKDLEKNVACGGKLKPTTVSQNKAARIICCLRWCFVVAELWLWFLE